MANTVAHPVAHPYRVLHFPQVPCEPYVAPARTFDEAIAISENLSLQHLFLYENKFIPDYSNIVVIQVWDGEEWVDMDEDSVPYTEAVERYTEFSAAIPAGEQ